MSFYKQMKLKIPDYKKSVIFIRSENDKFIDNYSYIE
jgi:hypothetical protein